MSDMTIDFAKARENMVECQVKPGGVRDMRIWDVLGTIPREAFLPDAFKELAYMDKDIEISGRTLMAPLTFARLAELAEISGDDLILDIACGTGYSTAVLAALGGTVVGLEEDKTAVAHGSEILQSLNIDNGVIIHNPHAQGHAAQGPYDVIFINGFVPEIPQNLFEQLTENGRLVCVTQNPEAINNGAMCGICVRKGTHGLAWHNGFEISTAAVPGFEKEAAFVF